MLKEREAQGKPGPIQPRQEVRQPPGFGLRAENAWKLLIAPARAESEGAGPPPRVEFTFPRSNSIETSAKTIAVVGTAERMNTRPNPGPKNSRSRLRTIQVCAAMAEHEATERRTWPRAGRAPSAHWFRRRGRR